MDDVKFESRGESLHKPWFPSPCTFGSSCHRQSWAHTPTSLEVASSSLLAAGQRYDTHPSRPRCQSGPMEHCGCHSVPMERCRCRCHSASVLAGMECCHSGPMGRYGSHSALALAGMERCHSATALAATERLGPPVAPVAVDPAAIETDLAANWVALYPLVSMASYMAMVTPSHVLRPPGSCSPEGCCSNSNSCGIVWPWAS